MLVWLQGTPSFFIFIFFIIWYVSDFLYSFLCDIANGFLESSWIFVHFLIIIVQTYMLEFNSHWIHVFIHNLNFSLVLLSIEFE